MKKIPFLLLEIIILVSIITILVFLGIEKYRELFNNFPKYTVKFNDVDGLSVGSPVRLSGVHIGHIVKQEFKNDRIVITFKVTDKNIKIPPGSIAGIEFTGLAGSKSLEIRPPEKKTQTVKTFRKIEPVRLSSFMEIQNAIAGATLDFFNGILSFLNRNKTNAGANLGDFAETFGEQAASLEKIQEKIRAQSEKTSKEAEKFKELVQKTNENIVHAGKSINEFAKEQNIEENMQKVRETTEKVADFIESKKLENFNRDVKKLNAKLAEAKDRETGYIKEFNESVKTAAEKLRKLINSLEKKEKCKEKKDISL